MSAAPSAAQPRRALVLGASGSFGAHMAAALLARGWRVGAMARDPQAARRKAGARMPIDWVAGDAMNAADVAAAARGARLIVHAVNPPGYRNWAGTVMPMLEATIAAAKEEGARILLPGSVYNFAPGSGEAIGEHAPQAPQTRKGRIRAAMEARLAGEAAACGLKSLILRSGDFFGPATPNSALAFLVVRAGGAVRALLRPGPATVGHAFAYMPDLTRTAAMLLEREAELGDFEVFHFAGHQLDGTALLAAVREAAGAPRLRALPLPWSVLRAMAPFDETMREMLEMRYLWRRPIALANDRLLAFLGEEPHTPLAAALRATLEDGKASRPRRNGAERLMNFKDFRIARDRV